MAGFSIQKLAVEEFESVFELLEEGFPNISRDEWVQLYKRIKGLNRPKGYEHIGYLLNVENETVGVILAFYSERYYQDERRIVCNFSSWYISPKHRSIAVLMLKKITESSDVVFTNYSPIPPILPLFKACGFKTLAEGMMYVPPFYNIGRFSFSTSCKNLKKCNLGDFETWEKELLEQHLDLGCEGVMIEAEGRRVPLLWDGKKKGILTVARIVYCPDEDFLEKHAEDLNFYFLRQGVIGFAFDSAPTHGKLRGFFKKEQIGKLVLGETQHVTLDMAYSERVFTIGLWASVH